MKYCSFYSLFIYFLFQIEGFANTIYELTLDERRAFFETEKNERDFSCNYLETNIFLKNPFQFQISKIYTYSSTVIPNVDCVPGNLNMALKELNPSLKFNQSLINPEVIYVHPFLFYVNEGDNKVYYTKRIFKETAVFEEYETFYLEDNDLKIPTGSLKNFFYDRSSASILFFINNEIYSITIENGIPKLTKKTKISDINTEDICEFSFFPKGIIFLLQDKEIRFYDNQDFKLLQKIDHSNLNLTTDLNITSFYFDHLSNNLIFSDYVNGIYFFTYTEDSQNFFFQERLNIAKVLKLDYLDFSLNLIREISKKNFSTIGLEEYQKIAGKFQRVHEVFLSSFPLFESLVKTKDFLIIREPNLLHLYRPNLDNLVRTLPENEIYQEFHTENILEIKPFSLHNNLNDSFFLGIYKKEIKFYHPQVEMPKVLCHIAENVSFDKEFKFNMFLDTSLIYLNCNEKHMVNDHSNENFCRKNITFLVHFSNKKNNAIKESILTKKGSQIVFTVCIGCSVALILLCLIGLCLKKKYRTLKNEYNKLEMECSQLDLMSQKKLPVTEEDQNKV